MKHEAKWQIIEMEWSDYQEQAHKLIRVGMECQGTELCSGYVPLDWGSEAL